MDLTPLFVVVTALAVGLTVARLIRSPEERDFLQGGGLYLMSVLLGSGALATLEAVWGVPLAGMAAVVGAAFLLGDGTRVESRRMERTARTLEAVGQDPGETDMALEERLDELDDEPRFSSLSGLAAVLATIAVLGSLAYDLPLGYLIGGVMGWLPLQDWVRARTRDAERRSLKMIRKGLGDTSDEAIEP